MTLKPGAVYKYKDEEAIKSKLPHYFIVINNNPKEEPILIVTCVSSKVTETKERANKRKQEESTLVELSTSEYKFLTMDSIIDCNSILLKSKSFLIEKYKEGIFEMNEITNEQLIKIQKAFLTSKKHDKALKRIIDHAM